ncbi:uncharacterized protein LOC118419316 [Branchiostoma floridae]|uniref:Uncharacterized protein LOC118419316 n=1 Tax=Branchiostoma floridae TaxID=7739 RepID=A0A9J7LH29_BRAFL|nr:uncharacterized protein LOC118419316 [Branchiostoma floridae]
MADIGKHLDETVRDQWESPVQWDARKKFILHNWDQHPEDQLVCLSNVWANMEFFGCRYNPVVEQRVKEMAAGMPEFQKPELPQSTADQEDNKKRKEPIVRGGKRDLKTLSDPPHRTLKHIDLKKMISFTSGGVLGGEGRKTEEQPPMKQETESESFEASTFSVQPSTSSSPSMLGRNEVQQESSVASDAKNSTVSTSKPSPFFKPNTLSIDMNMNEQPSILLENCVQRSLLVKKKRFFSGLSETVRSRFAEMSGVTKKNVGEFTQYLQQCRLNPLHKIVEVTSSSTFVLETDRAEFPGFRVPGFACDLYIEGVYLARGYGRSKALARKYAVMNALERLRDYSTVGVSTRSNSETGKLIEEFVIDTGEQVPLHPTLSADSLPLHKPKTKGAREEGPIKETNIGKQMLRKMGWSGGGIGKVGREGIAEPIKVEVNMERRAGLGYRKGKAGAKTSTVKEAEAVERLSRGCHRSVGVTTRSDSERSKLIEEFVIETGKQVAPTLPGDSLQGPANTSSSPQKPRTKKRDKKPKFDDSKSLSDFVIYEKAESAIGILSISAPFNRMKVNFKVNNNRRNGVAMYQCAVSINQMIVADAWSNTSKGLKHLAAEAALSKLRQTNPVVKPKKPELTEDALTRAEVLGTKEAGEGQTKETNISLGTATDIAEKQLITTKEAHQFILNYIQSGREEDQVFSPELTPGERAAIHQKASQFYLQTKQYGVGQNRYLVIGRKRSAQDVMALAQFRPGQYGTVVVGDGKYEVTLPQNGSWQ